MSETNKFAGRLVGRNVATCLALMALVAGLAVSGLPARAGWTPERYEFVETHMGASIKITFYDASQTLANNAAAAAFKRFAAVNRIMSDYHESSELSRLSATAGSNRWVEVSDPLWNVLEKSQKLAEITDGAFDITVGPAVRLWRAARKSDQPSLPGDDNLRQALAGIGYKHLSLDAKRHAAKLLRPHMRLDLGGIAMGYAVDDAISELKRNQVKVAIIDASGDIYALGAPPGESGWKVAIVPRGENVDANNRMVMLCNQGMATSGDAYQFVEVGGKRYSHIVDPRTGLGLTDQIAATVIAKDCVSADSLATAVCVLGTDRGLQLIEQTPNAAAYIVQGDADSARSYQSERTKQLQLIAPK